MYDIQPKNAQSPFHGPLLGKEKSQQYFPISAWPLIINCLYACVHL